MTKNILLVEYDESTITIIKELFQAPLFEMAQRGLLRAKVERTYPLSEAKAAIAHATQDKRSGKIVFRFDA